MYRYIMIDDQAEPVNTQAEAEEASRALDAHGLAEAQVWELPDEPDDNDPNAYADARATASKIFA